MTVCEQCGAPAEPAQVQVIGAMRKRWPAFCGDCLHAGSWTPGSKEAFERLLRGEVDPDEAARVAAATPSPYDDPPRRQGDLEKPPYRFALPEQLR